MEQLILVGYLLVCLAIIGLIMVQRGKGADIGASFGTGASQTLFGSTGGGNVLTQATAWLAAAFFAGAFGLAVIADSQTASVDDLGFDIPADVAVPATLDAAPAEALSDLPVIDSDGATLGSDLPDVDVVEEVEGAAEAAAEDLPPTDNQ